MGKIRHNEDYKPPWAETYQYGPVSMNSHSDIDKLPIFWGPGQLNSNYPNYTAPSTDKWHSFENINIPKVVRFIHASTDENDDYDDPDNPSDGSGGPFNCPGFKYLTDAYTYQMIIKDEFIHPEQLLDIIIEPPDFSFMTGSDRTAFIDKTVMENAHIIVYDHNDGTVVLYSGGPLACPYARFKKARNVVWFIHCEGGGLPAEGKDTLIFSAMRILETGENFTDPPKCWVKMMSYNPATREYDIWNGSYTSEVPYTAQNWYGCGEVPGSPPATPPHPPNGQP